MLSMAEDHEVGLPSSVLNSDDVTAMQIALSAVGFEISAKATACSVIDPYNSVGLRP
jgi:5-enolpyruvylshikimate-3-phosphate synthase